MAESLEGKVFDIPEKLKETAYINNEKYLEMYKRSVEDPEGFWAEIASEFITWDKKWDKVLEWDFRKGDIKWFQGAKLNVSYNCLDRHLENGNADKVAILWEGNEPSEVKKFTYKDLHAEVSKLQTFSNLTELKKATEWRFIFP